MLVTIFGNTTFAVSTVLSAYMTGLAIGSYAFGRLIDRRGGKALLIYALLQTGVAVSAVLLTMALWNVTPVLVWVQRALSESAVHLAVVRYLIVFSLLVVPTTLMGGTLPVLSKFLVERRSSLGRYVGVLYALNTLGAALGCFAAGFLLIGRLGLDLTVWSAAALNLGIGAVSWALARRRGVATGGLSVGERAASPIGSSGLPGPEETGGGDGGPSLRTLVLFAMAFSGFAALGYEVIWTKALIFSLGNSVYAFATMLTTFLIGLALGSLFCSWLVDRGKRLMAGLGVVEAGIGVYGILCVHLFASLIKPSSSEVTAATAGPSPLVGTGFLDTFWVMLLPTLLMGATFPLAVRICTVTVGRVGRGTGSVYSFNTVGSVLGSTVTGFVLLPLLGLQRGLIALGLVNVTVGLLLCAVEPRMRRGTKVIVLGALVGALLTALWTTPENVFRRAFEQGTKFVYYKEDVSGVVWVQEDGPDRSLFIDRRDMAGTYGRLFDSQRALGHLPLLLHPNPRRVFVLGFGAGGACYSIGTHPEVERLDAAEICPPVLEAAEFLTRISRGILDDPRFHLYLNDGRNFLLTARGSYDVISVDLLYPDCRYRQPVHQGVLRDLQSATGRRRSDGGMASPAPDLLKGPEGYRPDLSVGVSPRVPVALALLHLSADGRQQEGAPRRLPAVGGKDGPAGRSRRPQRSASDQCLRAGRLLRCLG